MKEITGVYVGGAELSSPYSKPTIRLGSDNLHLERLLGKEISVPKPGTRERQTGVLVYMSPQEYVDYITDLNNKIRE